MFCSSCGARGIGGSEYCDACSAPMRRQEQLEPGPASSHLAWSIFMAFCFLPTGIVAILYSSKARTLNAVGNYVEAQRASASAARWCWASFGIWMLASGLMIMGLLVFAIRVAEAG